MTDRDEVRLDDLQRDGMGLYQSRDKYRFTTDAVLLADFARVKRGETVCDFGTGSGVVLLLTAARCPQLAAGYGIEVQPDMAALAARNIIYNRKEDKLSVLCGRIQDAAALLPGGRVDAVVCNPPYRRAASGLASEDYAIAVSRHEVLLTLPELTAAAASVLGTGGRFYLTYPAERLAELMRELYAARLTPKTLRLVAPRADRAPHLALVEAVRAGRDGLKVLPQLALSGEDGAPTDELAAIYARRA